MKNISDRPSKTVELKSKNRLSYASIAMTPVIIYVASLLKGVQAKEAMTDWLQSHLEPEISPNSGNIDMMHYSLNDNESGQVNILDNYASDQIIESQKFILLKASASHIEPMAVHQFEQTDFALISEPAGASYHTETTLWNHQDLDLSTNLIFDDIAIQAATENTELSSASASGSSSTTVLWVLLGAAIITGIVVGSVVGTEDDNDKPGNGNNENLVLETLLVTEFTELQKMAVVDNLAVGEAVVEEAVVNSNLTVGGELTAGDIWASNIETVTMTVSQTMTMEKDLVVGGKLTAKTAEVGELAAGTIETVNIAAATAEVGAIDAVNIAADMASVWELTANTAEVGLIDAVEISVWELAADTAEVGAIDAVNIAADMASVWELTADTAEVGAIDAVNIAADMASVWELTAKTAEVSELAAGTIETVNIAAATAEVGAIDAVNIAADMASVWELTANTAEVGELAAGTIETVNIAAATAEVGAIDAVNIAADMASVDELTTVKATISGLVVESINYCQSELNQDPMDPLSLFYRLATLDHSYIGAIEKGTEEPTCDEGEDTGTCCPSFPVLFYNRINLSSLEPDDGTHMAVLINNSSKIICLTDAGINSNINFNAEYDNTESFEDLGFDSEDALSPFYCLRSHDSVDFLGTLNDSTDPGSLPFEYHALDLRVWGSDEEEDVEGI